MKQKIINILIKLKTALKLSIGYFIAVFSIKFWKNLSPSIKHHIRNISGVKKTKFNTIEEHSGSIGNSLMYTLNVTYKMFLIMFGIATLWLVFARLDSTVAGNGVVTPISRKKIIQHLEGGIVDKILVKEGDFVDKNQTLVILNDIQAKAALNSNLQLLVQHLVRYQRLKSEAKMTKEFIINKDEINYNKDYIENIIDQEKKTLIRNIDLHTENLTILQEKYSNNELEINKNNRKLELDREYLKVIQRDVRVERLLVKKRMGDYEKLQKLKKEFISQKNLIQQTEKMIKQLRHTRGDIKNQIDVLKNEYKKRIGKDTDDTYRGIHDLKEKIAISSDIESRTKIKSPSHGIVTHLYINGEGQTISNNTNIMEIIPLDEELIIEAKFSPKDISLIYQGLDAKIIPNLAENKLKKYFMGKVIHVSRDVQIAHDGSMYFIVKIKTNKPKFDDITIVPGMQATILVKLGSRAPIMYILEPFINSIVLSFNEY